MDPSIPFCTRCGRVGPRLSGLHPDDVGIVRWTLFPCGHVNTEPVMDVVDGLAGPMSRPSERFAPA
jgi:hypothetical protein